MHLLRFWIAFGFVFALAVKRTKLFELKQRKRNREKKTTTTEHINQPKNQMQKSNNNKHKN